MSETDEPRTATASPTPVDAASSPDATAAWATAAGDAVRKPLSPAAERALAEAAARRAEIDRKTTDRPTELQGRGGLEPVRYGDWEVKGIASDF